MLSCICKEDKRLLRIKRLNKKSIEIYKNHENDVGFDLFFLTRKPGQMTMKRVEPSDFEKPITIEIPKFCYGKLNPRSGLLFTYSNDFILNDDDEFTVCVEIFNLSDKIVKIGKNSDLKQLKSDYPVLPITMV
jgi:dUTPase